MNETSTFLTRKLRVSGLCFVIIGAGALAWPHIRPLLWHDQVDFSRDIQPIFNQNCGSCHGGVRQTNNVSFIYRGEALGKGKSGRPTIVPGDPDASELMRRVTFSDTERQMLYREPPLPPEQIELLRCWIKQGAPWEEDYWVQVRDLHATMLYFLGFDHRRLQYPFQGLDQKLTSVKPAHVVAEVVG